MGRWVVAGTDGSPAATAAVEWAARDAVRHGSGLRIVHVREQWAGEAPFRTLRSYHDSLIEHCEEMLERAAGAARDAAPGVEVTTSLLEGDLIQRLLRESEAADHVVIGSRGLGGFSELLLGSVGMGVAGHAASPVVVVRGDSVTRHGRIVVGVDGSEPSQAALAYAFREAEVGGAEVHAVQAWQPAPTSALVLGYGTMVEEMLDVRAEISRRSLAPWRDRCPGVKVTESIVCGHPVGILCEASAEADLVVVGSRGHGPIVSAVFGSVSHGVLHHSQCPVAVVRPHQEPHHEPHQESSQEGS